MQVYSGSEVTCPCHLQRVNLLFVIFINNVFEIFLQIQEVLFVHAYTLDDVKME